LTLNELEQTLKVTKTQ